MNTNRIVICAALILVPATYGFAQEQEVSLQQYGFDQDKDIPLQLMRFESEWAYDQYAEWIADMDNIRFAIIESGKTWSPEVETWAKEYIQTPKTVESNDGVYLITYAAGGLDDELAEQLLYTVSNAYESWFHRRRMRAEEEEKARVETELRELQERAAEAGIVEDAKALQNQLAEVKARLLETRLEAAQAEARVQTVLEHMKSKEETINQGLAKANSAERALLAAKLDEARASMAQTKQLHERGFVTELDMRKAEQRLMEIEVDLVKLEAEQVQKASVGANAEMRRMLIDAEAERAAALALERGLREQAEKLEQSIRESAEHSRRIQQLQRQPKPPAIQRGTPVNNINWADPRLIRPEAREEMLRERKNQVRGRVP